MKKICYIILSILIFSSCKKEYTKQDSLRSLYLKKSKVLNFTNKEIEQYFNKYKNINGVKLKSDELPVFDDSFVSLREAAEHEDHEAQITSELIDDEVFENVLNSEGEIIINNNIYKVTPLGTFATLYENKDHLEAIYLEIQKLNPITNESKLTHINVEPFIDHNQMSFPEQGYSLINGIYFIPTFANDKISFIEEAPSFEGPKEALVDPTFLMDSELSGTGGWYGPGMDNYQPSLSGGGTTPNQVSLVEDGIFDNLLLREMNNPDGSIWKTIFENSTEYNYFNNEYRTSVLLYNRNYGFGKSVGIKVKHQKKGLLWWNKTRTEKIAAGWVTLEFESKEGLPNSVVEFNKFMEQQQYNTVQIYKSGNIFNLIIPYDIHNPTGIGRQKFHGDYRITEKTIKPLLVSAWKWIKPRIIKDLNGKVTAVNLANGSIEKLSLDELDRAEFGIIYRSEESVNPTGGRVRVLLAPYLSIHLNDDKIEKEFDFQIADFQISMSSNLQSTTINPNYISNLEKIVTGGFKFVSADVIGSSKRNGVWRGVRVYKR